MSIDIQKWKAEAHENAAKTVANMLQVSEKVLSYIICMHVAVAISNILQYMYVHVKLL